MGRYKQTAHGITLGEQWVEWFTASSNERQGEGKGERFISGVDSTWGQTNLEHRKGFGSNRYQRTWITKLKTGVKKTQKQTTNQNISPYLFQKEEGFGLDSDFGRNSYHHWGGRLFSGESFVSGLLTLGFPGSGQSGVLATIISGGDKLRCAAVERQHLVKTEKDITIRKIITISQTMDLTMEQIHPVNPHPEKMLPSQSSGSFFMSVISSCIFCRDAWMSGAFDVRLQRQRPLNA